MKNLSLILNGVLFVLIIILFILHFSGKTGPTPKQEKHKQNLDSLSEEVDSLSKNPYKVAIVNFDSLISKYDYYRQMEIEMRNKAQSYQKELIRKQKQFRKDRKAFLENGASMSLEEQKQRKRELQQRKKKLQKLMRKRQMEMQNQQREVNKKVVQKISSFMKKYADKHGYDYIMSFRPALGNFVFGRDSTKVNDVTQEVLHGLNSKLQENTPTTK